ncbi:MAG: LuxR C-terminal-related transcriptional regulator [Micromonosporaceae bacterium]
MVVLSHRRLMRDALCAYLASRPDFDVVGEAAGVAGLAGLCSLRRPAVVLVEAPTLSMEIIEALRGVREANPATEIVIAYTEISPLTFSAAVQAGITALVPSSQGLDAVVQAMRAPGELGGRTASPTAALTDREMQIMSLLGTGSSVPEIADSLRISPRTVENHKRHIYTKLGVGSASHAVSRATSLGLIDTPTIDASALPTGPPAEGAPIVLVHGPAGLARDLVVQALAESGLPFMTPDPGEVAADGSLGPVTTVLVDPGPADWAPPSAAPVVVWSAAPDRGALLDSLRHGAQAVLAAAEVPDQLAGVLALVARGYAAMSRAHLTELTELVTRGPEHPTSGVPELTPREREILDSISQGHTVRQTARTLGIATKTVENTQARLFRKLGARNRAGALTIAYRMGIVHPEPPGVV